MSRLNDETTFLLQSQVDNVDQQNHQLMKPGVLHPLYSIFSVISCISRYLSMKDLIAFRAVNRTMNEASEKAFLYWISLKILRGLSKITDQENIPLSISPLGSNPGIKKTIHFPAELNRFIAKSLNREKIARLLFLQRDLEPTVESISMQKHFIQLCRDIGDGAPESETRDYFCPLFCMAIGVGHVVAPIPVLVQFAPNDKTSAGKTLGGIMEYIMCVGVVFCAISLIQVLGDDSRITDQYNSRLVLSAYSARMFKRVANSAHAVAMPVDWMRLSKTNETASQLKS